MPAVSLFVIGRLPGRLDLDGEPCGEPGDTVYRVRIETTDLPGLAAAQLDLARQVSEAALAGQIVFVGACSDGALTAAADWVEAAHRGLRLQRARWGGSEPGMEGGEPGGASDGGAAAKPEAAASELGPGELGKATGTIYFDPELGVVVEVSDKQMFRLSQSAGGRTYTRKVEINLASKVRKVEDAAAQ